MPLTKSSIFKNSIVKNILSALAVAGFGFILLNAAFIFNFLFQRLVGAIIGFFTPLDLFDLFRSHPWFPPLMHFSFVAIIGIISWLIFRTKLGVLYKAIYMTVPLAVVYVTFGMFLYRWPAAAYSLSGLFTLGILYYFYRTKQPWLYYYTVILVSLTLLIFNLSGGEI